MRPRIVRLVLAFYACVAAMTKATHAMTFTPVPVGDRYIVIEAVGQVEIGDAERLRVAIQSAPAGRVVASVDLNSDGGNLLEAEKLAVAIRNSGLGVLVASGEHCASACFIPFAAARHKLVAADALIGVHSASTRSGEETLQSMGATTAMARDLAAYDVPEEIIGRLVETTPGKIAWLSGAELKSMGVSFADVTSLASSPPVRPASSPQSAPCLIIGDDLAVGISLHRPECHTVAQYGISSARYVKILLTPMDGATAVISLGVNDSDDTNTLQNLRRVRASIHAKRVFWLLPGIKPRVRDALRTVAVEYDDFVVDARFEAGPDHLHPSEAGYRFLAAMVP